MAVVRWDPLRDITSLRDEMNRLFSRSIGDGYSGSAQTWAPAVDVVELPDAIVVTAEVPGLSADDIDIEVDDNVLSISGERKFETKVEDGRYYRLERSYGRFSRSLGLPQGVKADEISAEMDNGVLQLRVPKADEVKPRKIAVAAGRSDQAA
jgi:HSP20 family protein